MKLLFRVISTASLALALSAPASANQQKVTQTARDGSEILVIGQKEGKKRFHDFVKTVVKETDEGQYARIRSPICPTVKGLKRGANKYIELRIRNVAEAADMRVGGKRCRANINVMLVDDPVKFLTRLRKTRRTLFEALTIAERDSLLASAGPAYTWKSSADFELFGGSSVSSMGQIIGSKGSMGGGLQMKDGARAPMSKIASAVEHNIKGSFIVIEKSALIGNNLTQIADYAAVRSFVDIDDAQLDDLRESSILTLFKDRKDGAIPMEHISDWDLALINALYHTRANLGSMHQREAMVGKIQRDVEVMQSAVLPK